MKKDDVWSRYDAWNEAVLETVLPELEMPEPVYLDFEDDVLDGLSTRMGVPADRVEGELASAVAATLRRGGGPASVFAPHVQRTAAWRRRGREETPPFLALLSSFCLAAERMTAGDGMAANNFFGRLGEVLGWDTRDGRLDLAYRRVAERLWGDLNRWLVDLDGLRGLPTAYALSHRYVGLTVSQALVRTTDRERLKEFFRQYGFAPGAEVAPSELVSVLDSWIGQRPTPVSANLERLWRGGQAKERIAQAAAVALSGWDGSVRERRGRDGDGAPRGHMALTLGLGGFPRKRFELQAVMYLPQAGTPRDASVLTAQPQAVVELVPDLPGSLGLGRGSSLHAGDVLEGVLRIEDSLSGQVLERRPRRLVLFREDELSRRWVEATQVMLGDDVRLLVHNALVPRVREVLASIARPGWSEADRYPGQPESWTLFIGVEVFSHPGALVRNDGMDDLAALVPLTTSQLKVAGGFALPGQLRGKWHSWAPPEVRAVSDDPDGFVVRVVDLQRFVEEDEDPEEVVLAEWSDEGAGVLVCSLAELGLEDGDYRVELLARSSNQTLSTTTVLLRSADTPDQRQWSLLEGAGYGPGIGALGVAVDGLPRVRGHVVEGGSGELRSSPVPAQPSWQVGRRSAARTAPDVRLTIPDADSCIHTGRHREQIETVPTDNQGRPLKAWSFGRCRGCGLERRYPTRLRRSSFGRGRGAPRQESAAPGQHDVSVLPDADSRDEGKWATAFDAVLHTGGGSWSHLERIAYQIEPTALFLDQFARTLEVLGHIDVTRAADTLEPVAWEVTPTSLAGTSDGFLFSGYWPGSLYARVGRTVEDAGIRLAVSSPEDDLASYFVDATPDVLGTVPGIADVAFVPESWRQIASALPPLSQILRALPRRSAELIGDITWFQPADGTWAKVVSVDAPGAYRVRRFTTLDVVRSVDDVETGTVARATVQLGKHLAALIAGRAPLFAYDANARCVTVPLGADLPALYGRAIVSASGVPPEAVREQRVLRYDAVPSELAGHVFDLLRS